MKHIHTQTASKFHFDSKPLLTLIACCLAAPFGAHAMNTFSPVTNLLAIDQLTVTSLGVYKDVRATILSYSLLGVDNGVAQADSFDPSTKLLTLGSVTVEGNTYTNVRVKINALALLGGTLSVAESTTPTTPTTPTTTYYFSDCQTGAATGCLPGSNANLGTQAAPKQNLAGIDVNALPAGTSLLFARGGSWNWSPLMLENGNTTAAAPLVFDAYGTGPLPTFRQFSDNMFHLGGGWNNTSNDGGYTFRNIKFDGRGTAAWGFWFVHTVRDVVIENSEITGFAIGINSNDSDAHGVRGITLRNNNIHHNYDMGMLGHYNDLLIEGNIIEANNFSGSGFSHGTYLGGGNNITIRNNRYLRNSVVNGVCQGGNMTFHGQINGLLIEGNRIEQDAGGAGCWLMSITTGYTTAEWFLNTVVRNNKLINGGNNALVAQAAPGIVVEGNVAINTQATNQVSFNVGGGVGAGDTLDANAVVRNNTACQSGGAMGSVVSVNSPGATVTNNVVVTGTAATTGICAR